MTPGVAPSDIERCDDVLIPLGDGTVAATRYSPVDYDAPLPVVLMATPYRKDDKITYGSHDSLLKYLAAHGYEVVVTDLLGTGASSGHKPESHHAGEADELVAVIEWLADRAWTTGRVGMIGISYGGWTQLQAAAKEPDALEAIVPVAIGESVHDRVYPGGAFDLLRRPAWTTMMQALSALPPSRRDTEGGWAAVWEDHLEDLETRDPWLFQFLDHEREDDAFWREKTIPIEEIAVPTLAVCGYRDIYTLAMTAYFERIDAPKRFLLGPWRHRFPHEGREAAVDFRRQAVEWFDHFLKDEDTGALERPTMTVWTERAGGWQVCEGVWRGLDRWPTVDTADETVEFSLAPDGVLEPGRVDGHVERAHDVDHTVGTAWLDRVASVTNTEPETTADDRRGLTFETPPLENSLELTGTPEATIRFRSRIEDPLIAVQLNDVAPDGTSRPIGGNHRRLNNRGGSGGSGGSTEDSAPVGDSETHAVTLRLSPKSHVFETGHRIRLVVSGANFPRALPPREQDEMTVLSDPDSPSTLTVPGREHREGVDFDDAVEMEPPDERVPTDAGRVIDSRGDWNVVREPEDDAVRFLTSSSTTTELPHARLTEEYETVAGVHAAEPATAYVKNEAEFALDYGDEEVTASATSRVTQWVAVMTTEVAIDGQPVFEQIRRRDPRRALSANDVSDEPSDPE